MICGFLTALIWYTFCVWVHSLIGKMVVSKTTARGSSPRGPATSIMSKGLKMLYLECLSRFELRGGREDSSFPVKEDSEQSER